MKLTDERLLEIIKTHPESDEREQMAVELRQLRAALRCPRCLGTGKVVGATAPHGSTLTLLDCGSCGDVRASVRR